MTRNAALLLALAAFSASRPAGAEAPLEGRANTALEARVRAVLGKPELAGSRWGLRVEDHEGHVLVSINPDDRFQPASNTKVFVTTSVFDAMAHGTFPNLGTQVRMEPGARGRQNVVLVGRGDAMLADGPDCRRDCLAELADAVAKTGVKKVGDVIGDDTLMPFERWVISERLRPGTRTIISALTLNDNEFAISAQGGAQPGDKPTLASPDLEPEFTLVNQITTGPATAQAEVHVEMVPGERRLRLFGTLPAGGKAETLRFDVDDPADYAALRLARLLRARGVKVEGKVLPRHAPLAETDIFATAPAPAESPALATLTPHDLAETLTITAKVSQNLYAHLFLKKLALAQGKPATTPAGLGVLNTTIAQAGLPRWSYDFYDGSGLSPDNRITPRAMVHYLHWVDAQPWAASWRQTLPVAGVDGTLRRRFKGTPLQGRLFAKTGTLLAANALAGYMATAGGKELVFSIYANDRPSGLPSVLPAMDEALNLIAAAN